jgi:RNA polymerase sigma-70 factor (ECF subfamily)
MASWYRGREAVAAFLARRPLSGRTRWRLVPIRACGQLAFGHYLWDAEQAAWTPHGINVITLGDGGVEAITAFITPELFPRFGLPEQLAS